MSPVGERADVCGMTHQHILLCCVFTLEVHALKLTSSGYWERFRSEDACVSVYIQSSVTRASAPSAPPPPHAKELIALD